MNFSIFLILLGIIRLVSCTRSNTTGDDSCNICTLSYFRRKRANTEYTRWRATETQPEFIVKVLEDDIVTPETKHIPAINIQPITKGQEKIIIRGAVIPQAKESNLDLLKEYTRFVPPTNFAGRRDDKTDKNFEPVKPIIDGVQPEHPYGKELNYGHIPNSFDESSSPSSQLWSITSATLLTRQYAPILPVSFTQRNKVGPLTQRAIDKFMLAKTTARPTRTTVYSDILIPMRTSELGNVVRLKYTNSLFDNFFISRSTVNPFNVQRTSTVGELPIEDDNLRKYHLENKLQPNKNIDKESDTSYNDLFYNYEDGNESTTMKRKLNVIENSEDNKKTLDKLTNSETTLKATDNYNDFEVFKPNMKNEQSYFNYEDEYVTDNATVTCGGETGKTVTIAQNNEPLKNIDKKRNLVCSILTVRQLSFSSPLTLHEIVTQLKQWAEESPVAKWTDITRGNYTVMENPIHMMIVDDPSSGQIVSAKKTVLIVAGIQGRDHHAVTAAMYVLYQLIERSESHSDLLSKFRFWVIPVFNPDGYDYSMTFPHCGCVRFERREWSKNLRQSWDSCKGRESCQACEELGLRCTIQPCYGVNLDRNFEYQWIPAEELKAEHPCGNLYAGSRQLSEAETQALTRYLHDQRSPLYTFITFKEGDVLGIMYPYSHTRKRRAFDHVYRQRASQAASAAYSISGRPYVAGQASEFLPMYAGGVEDWMDGHLGIDNTYTIMMFRPTDSQNSKLVMERVIHEAYAAVDTLLIQRAEPLGPSKVTLTRAGSSHTISPSTTFIFIVTLIVLGYG